VKIRIRDVYPGSATLLTTGTLSNSSRDNRNITDVYSTIWMPKTDVSYRNSQKSLQNGEKFVNYTGD
jgi:hypothetical protein